VLLFKCPFPGPKGYRSSVFCEVKTVKSNLRFRSLSIAVYFIPIHNAVALSTFIPRSLQLAAFKVRHYTTCQADCLTGRLRVNENFPASRRLATSQGLIRGLLWLVTSRNNLFTTCRSKKSNWTKIRVVVHWHNTR